MSNSGNIEFQEIRNSLNNHLIRGDFLRALDKISDNLNSIRTNIKELRNFQINIGSKRDNKALNEQANNLLSITGDLFKDSIVLIKDFKDFKFPNKNDQVSNLRQLRLMESKCSDMKTEFDTLTYKITRQNKSILESHRNSRVSFPSTMNYNENKTQMLMGNELLAEERLADKEKQNNTIEKINKQLNELSVEQNKMIFHQGQMINNIELNVQSAETNLEKATDEVKESNELYGDQDGLLNKVCIAVIIIVIVLLIMMVILPD